MIIHDGRRGLPPSTPLGPVMPPDKCFHVRVLVPCYKESLGVLRATIEAALDAPLPSGCQRTVYLCDDGADPEKRTFVTGIAHLGVQ